MQHVYGICGFSFSLALSTRPKDFIGDVDVWDTAEAALQTSLETFQFPWKVKPGDGAFYGPKIDILLHGKSDSDSKSDKPKTRPRCLCKGVGKRGYAWAWGECVCVCGMWLSDQRKASMPSILVFINV